MISSISTLAASTVKLSGWFVLLAFLFVPLERFFSLKRQRVIRRRWWQDVGFFFLNGIAPPLLLSIPLSILALLIHRIQYFPYYSMMATLPVAFRLLMAFVIGEIGAYWGHRFSHSHPWLWHLHSVHHSSEEMDWLVNSRAHPLDMVFTRLCGLIPIYCLGLLQPTAARFDLTSFGYVFIGTVWAYAVHANIRFRFGSVEHWIATPAFHHWHHSNEDTNAYYVDFAAIFPWIDRIFSTFYVPSRRWPKSYGIIPEPMKQDNAFQH